MRRRWGSQRFIDRCRLVQERLDRPAITTDIIVGFPGETDAEFQETIDAARAVGFSKIHIFPFSPRRGTPAAEMPNQVPKHVQQERSRELAAVEAELARRILPQPDRPPACACWSEIKSRARCNVVGTSCRYATVELAGISADEGRFVDVVAVRVCGERIATSSTLAAVDRLAATAIIAR